MKKWTKREINILRELYPNHKKEIILKQLKGRSWDSVKHKAKKESIKRIGRPDNRSADLSRLLVENVEAYYWIGFIAADGYFVENRYLGVTIKEIDHLYKYMRFVDGKFNRLRKTKNNLYEFKCGDDYIVPKIKNKFDLKENKTYNPPDNLSIVNDELFLAFFIGFIDGDGSIVKQSGNRLDCYINIGLHESWFYFLKTCEQRLYDILLINHKRSNGLTKYYQRKTSFGESKLTQLRLADSRVVKALKKFAIVNKLPIIDRKWGKIKL